MQIRLGPNHRGNAGAVSSLPRELADSTASNNYNFHYSRQDQDAIFARNLKNVVRKKKKSSAQIFS